MFTLVFKIAQAAWKRLSASKDASLSSPTKDRTAAATDDCNTSDKYCGSGIVTKLNASESYGLINDCVYFNFSIVCGSEKVRVGQSVVVNATRKSVHHGWIADSVIVQQDDWTSDADEDVSHSAQLISSDSAAECSEKVRTLDAEITECYSKFGVADRKYRFYLKDCKVFFMPVVGDLLTVTLSAQLGSDVVEEWKPKTVKVVKGTVTALETDCGIINEDIVFFFSSCVCNFPVFCGQSVVATVIESKQQLFKWRACCLKRITDLSSEGEFLKACRHDHDDVSVTKNLDFGQVEVNEKHKMELTMKNLSKDDVMFIGCHFQRPAKSCPFSAAHHSAPHFIKPGSEMVTEIHCNPTSVGSDDVLLFLEFENFMIKRRVSYTAVDPCQSLLGPTQPFSQPRRNEKVLKEREEAIIIPGEKIRFPKANFAGHQPQYTVPSSLRKAVETGAGLEEKFIVLTEQLTVSNYVEKFSLLLHLEEIKMHQNLRAFDLCEAVMVRRGEFLCLTVPGLADGRPSLLVGDRAMLHSPNGAMDVVYEGYIHEVHRDDIYVKFHETFQNTYNGEIYDISFSFSRANLKSMHRSLRKVLKTNRAILFPSFMHFQKPLVEVVTFQNASNRPSSMSIEWYNRNLNDRQKEAVRQVLEARCRPLPHVIFGPPGTGKTVTVVEAVLQVFCKFRNSRILVCTPSNSAADLVAQRLLESKVLGKDTIVRLNSYQRNVDSIPEFIKPFCVDKDRIEEAVKLPIIISTCSTAGALHSLELAADHFSHVFIDEAGQLTEPEAMVAISIICGHRNGGIVMAGDPKQLGPVLQSGLAKQHGLQLSFMERIMQCPLYSRSSSRFRESCGYNPSLVTMLVNSYRSHEFILRFPSDEFYFSEMKCVSSKTLLAELPFLPKKGCPVLFHGVRGEETREENSPSWFNSAEVVQASRYLQRLYHQGLTPSDVGIIAPYRKQVEKIRVLLSAFNTEPCKIGSVEEFQGQERRAIIVSTVRSSKDFVHHDVIHNLGFLSNPKRFNVAITRAEELLIIVGNPQVLSLDPTWNKFIKFCIINGCYIGCDMTSADETVDDGISRQ